MHAYTSARGSWDHRNAVGRCNSPWPRVAAGVGVGAVAVAKVKVICTRYDTIPAPASRALTRPLSLADS